MDMDLDLSLAPLANFLFKTLFSTIVGESGVMMKNCPKECLWLGQHRNKPSHATSPRTHISDVSLHAELKLN